MKKDRVAKSTRWSVVFELSDRITASGVSVVGDFNAWEPAADPMKRRKDGMWARTVRLQPGVYHFRYYSSDGHWYNDPAADGYEPSGLGEDNSVLILGA